MANGDDFGVGPGGVALESNPAFARGGVPVTMDNIVRAETAKYLAEERRDPLRTGSVTNATASNSTHRR